jgi:hypothetical protein
MLSLALLLLAHFLNFSLSLWGFALHHFTVHSFLPFHFVSPVGCAHFAFSYVRSVAGFERFLTSSWLTVTRNSLLAKPYCLYSVTLFSHNNV